MRMAASLNVYFRAPVLILTRKAPKELKLSVVTGDDHMCTWLRAHSTTKLNQIITKICPDLEAISYKAFTQEKSTKLWVKDRGEGIHSKVAYIQELIVPCYASIQTPCNTIWILFFACSRMKALQVTNWTSPFHCLAQRSYAQFHVPSTFRSLAIPYVTVTGRSQTLFHFNHIISFKVL